MDLTRAFAPFVIAAALAATSATSAAYALAPGREAPQPTGTQPAVAPGISPTLALETAPAAPPGASPAPANAATPAKNAVTPARAGAQPGTPTRFPGITRITSVEGITEYRLRNGLKVLLFPDPSKPTVTVNITYLVGSRMENYGETGMAHLLEHLMFKGSKKHPAIDAEFNQRGVRYNGTTSFDRTNYFELFQAGDANL